MSKKQKIIVCTLAGILLIAAGILLFYFKSIVQQKKAFAENLIEQEKVSLLTDSLYYHFESTDLKMVDVKGYVHTLEFKEIADFNGLKRSILNLSLIFDKKGNIVDVKALYKQSNDLYTATFERNDNGQIESIAVRTSYITGGGDSYKGYLIYHLQYDDLGRVSGISIEDLSEGGRGGEMGDSEIKFSDYVQGKGYTKRTMDYDNGITINHESIHFVDVENDACGNWVSRSGNLTNRMSYSEFYLDEGEENTEQVEQTTMTEERTITYYKKEEIDFSPYLK